MFVKLFCYTQINSLSVLSCAMLFLQYTTLHIDMKYVMSCTLTSDVEINTPIAYFIYLVWWRYWSQHWCSNKCSCQRWLWLWSSINQSLVLQRLEFNICVCSEQLQIRVSPCQCISILSYRKWKMAISKCQQLFKQFRLAAQCNCNCINYQYVSNIIHV